jgi:hypothetical protein
MSKNEELGDTEPRGISRRTVAIGAAWAVPVIALATASPAYAASTCTPVFSLGGDSCKCPGQGQNNKQYFLNICVTDASGCTNPAPGSPDAIYIWGVKNQSGNSLTPTNGGQWPVTINLSNGAGCSGKSEYEGAGNSANGLYFLYNSSSVDSTGAVWSSRVDSPPDCTTGCGA